MVEAWTASTSPAWTLVICVGSQDGLEKSPFCRRGQGIGASAGGQEGGAVPYPPLPFTLLQERHLRRESVVVEGGLDLKNLYLAAHEPTDAPGRGVQFGVGPVHQRTTVLQCPDIMVVADAAVTHEARRGRFMAAVHSDEVYVDVNEQVRFGHLAVDFDILAFISLPQHDQSRWVLGVVLQQCAVRGERVKDTVTKAMAQFCFGHPPVQPERRYEDHVVDARLGSHVQNGLYHPLTVVGAAHRR